METERDREKDLERGLSLVKMTPSLTQMKNTKMKTLGAVQAWPSLQSSSHRQIVHHYTH